VRKFNKDADLTYLDRVLKNNHKVPIAGSTNICHMDAPSIGERGIKWFGVIRSVDLQNFRSSIRNPGGYRAVGTPVTHRTMHTSTPHEIRIRIDQLERLLMFDYDPDTVGALFDICDRNGHILKTGEVTGPVTQVRLTDVNGDNLILMVLDGETSAVRPIHLRQAS